MNNDSTTKQQYFTLFLLGCIFFNYPLLAVFNNGGIIFGIPALYVYIFSAWMLLIGIAALIAARRS